jgi:hypothetical protein
MSVSTESQNNEDLHEITNFRGVSRPICGGSGGTRPRLYGVSRPICGGSGGTRPR